MSEGEWVRGPDGRLDMDVSIRGIIDGREVLVAIECKDFRPGSTGPVGRAYVDALDSKRHDLKADLAIICSNSGFTKDALSKAKRKGIGMISVLRAGDHRVKVVIEEQIYLRRVTFTFWESTFYAIGNTLKSLAPAHDQILFMGRSVSSWLHLRASLIACTNPTLEHIQANFNFMNPLTCQVGSNDVVLSAVSVKFSYNTQWLTQTVQLDASLGLYDYVRGRMRVRSGYMVKGVNFDTAEVIPPPRPLPPIAELQPTPGLLPGEIDLGPVMCEGLPSDLSQGIPPLEEHVRPDDLKLTLLRQ